MVMVNLDMLHALVYPIVLNRITTSGLLHAIQNVIRLFILA